MSVSVATGIRLHRAGQLDRAEAIYRKVLAGQPEHADALHFLGVLLHQRGDSAGGVQNIQRALSLKPDYLDARKNLGNILLEMGQPQAAEQCYRLVTALAPRDADAWNKLGVALRSQRRHAESAQAGEHAVSLDPKQLAAWFNYAIALKANGQMEACIEAYRQALKLDAAFIPAHVELCRELYRMERLRGRSESLLAERIGAYRDWLARDPGNPVPRFMLAACEGDTTAARAPDAFVRKLFDGFAGYFDQNLAALDYRAPQLLGELLAAWGRSGLEVLDAGCGTGLGAPFLKPLARRLVGVDLSGEMLKKARGRQLYDELVEAELTAYLAAHPAAFDLVASADTLIYFGDLREVLAAAAASLRDDGRLVFSLEKPADECSAGYLLTSSGRYAHAEAYVREILAGAGLQRVSCSEQVLRHESGEPVPGLIFDAFKAPAAS